MKFYVLSDVINVITSFDSRWVGPDRVRNSKRATETVKYADSHQSLLIERGGMTHT